MSHGYRAGGDNQTVVRVADLQVPIGKDDGIQCPGHLRIADHCKAIREPDSFDGCGRFHLVKCRQPNVFSLGGGTQFFSQLF